MVAALRLHRLGDGELPLYTTDASFVYFLSVFEDDPPASHWERVTSRGRIFIPLQIDLPYRYLATNILRDWLLDLESLCPEGTLIFSLRTAAEIGESGRFILAGLGCIPSGTLEGSFPLQGADPSDLILAICRGESDVQHPAAQNMLSEEMVQRGEASRRARNLLDRFLTLEQRTELDETKAFHVRGQDGSLYRIRRKHAHNVELIEDGKPTIRYCTVPVEDVPLYDQMLGQKLLLERNIEKFLLSANFRFLEDGTEGHIVMQGGVMTYLSGSRAR